VTVSKERTGILFILVGPGGVGKNALLKTAVQKTENLRQLPTATTRSMRSDEQQGREHHFISRDDFQEMIDSGALLEYQEVHPGSFYGVPRATVEKAITEGRDLIADIEVLGAAIIRKSYPDNSASIFIAPPSVEDLIDRLKQREATEEEIDDRLRRLPMEMLYTPACDYVLVNDLVDHAEAELISVIQARREDTLGERLPAVTIAYQVNIAPMNGEEVLCRIGPGARFVAGQLRQAEHPEQAALRVLENALPILAPTPEHLHYGHPGDALPVDLEYRREENLYQITYWYTYRLDERIPPPDGWTWTPYCQLESV
jgi:guanylate kinase